MPFLSDLALAHRNHEGWYPGSRSWRNNNPGNLRAGPPEDKDGFTIFGGEGAGFEALMYDIRAKITNRSPAMDRYYAAHHMTYEQAVFLDYVKVYAPEADGNSPQGYAQALLQAVGKYGVTMSTPLADLRTLIETGSLPQKFDPQKAEQTAEQIAANAPEPRRSRILDRIRKYFPSLPL